MLQKQAKTLSAGQIRALESHLKTTRHPVRNRVVFLLSLRAGLRAKEIASLTWSMVTDAEGNLANAISLTDAAAKGRSGGTVPMAKELREAFEALRKISPNPAGPTAVVQTERSGGTSAQVIVNMFRDWYRELGFEGCSSHSGRRTFITMTARNIGRYGGSLRDVQALARHSSLALTQRYIEIDSEAMKKVVDGW
ncbi:tyrosine-type recombinase/integrase [Sphingomonas daechungensis]|uniref:tyrosine-type recombinase/integrase n=1 Tax=Sphingomonas daechungensis TaxID=1176646 RepID=UPI0037836542